MCLRNQNSLLSLRLINVLSAEEGFCPMSSWHDRSYCRICCSPINRSSKLSVPSIYSLLRWRLDNILLILNGQPTFRLLRRGGGCWTPTVQEQQLQLPDVSSSYNDICTYWAVNPAFDPQKGVLTRLFFINGDKTNYMSVGFYTARDYNLLVEFSAICWGWPKSIILTDEQV